MEHNQDVCLLQNLRINLFFCSLHCDQETLIRKEYQIGSKFNHYQIYDQFVLDMNKTQYF